MARALLGSSTMTTRAVSIGVMQREQADELQNQAERLVVGMLYVSRGPKGS